MFLRRLNLTKRCVLSTERQVLMHQMAVSEAEALDNRSDNLATVSRLAAQLQQNTAEDRQVYYKLARALYRGVSVQPWWFAPEIVYASTWCLGVLHPFRIWDCHSTEGTAHTTY